VSSFGLPEAGINEVTAQCHHSSIHGVETVEELAPVSRMLPLKNTEASAFHNARHV